MGIVDPFAEMHHLVSRGYQRNFADQWHCVTVIEARTGGIVDVARPIKRNFVSPGYNTRVNRDGAADSRLEREFAKLERPILDQIRRITPARCGPDLRQAVVTLFALHLVRSEAFQQSHERIIDDLRRYWLPELASAPELRQRYAAEYGVEATDQAIIQIGEQVLAENARANRLHVDGMVRTYNKLAAKLAQFHVQVITSDQLGMGFALGDVPVVHANIGTGQYGFRDRLAIGDANLIVGPLTRSTAVALSVRPMDAARLTVKRRLQELNAVFARAALHDVACHPDDAIEVRRVCQSLDRFPPDKLVGR